jgi:hypothetical protein
MPEADTSNTRTPPNSVTRNLWLVAANGDHEGKKADRVDRPPALRIAASRANVPLVRG